MFTDCPEHSAVRELKLSNMLPTNHHDAAVLEDKWITSNVKGEVWEGGVVVNALVVE